MHEWGLANDIVKAVADEASRQGGGRVTEVRLRIGTMSGVSADALAFGFEAAAAGTVINEDSLRIEEIVAESECECGKRFPDHDGMAVCPQCGGIRKKTVSGRELQVVSFLMEDDADSQAP